MPMQTERPSETAFRAAIARARHQVLDEPKVMDDPIAIRIVGEHKAAEIRANEPGSESRIARLLRGGIVGRSRIAEDALHTAMFRDGVSQYVVLGAGLDTFAYRNPHPASVLKVFEVDHPATQAWKRRLLQEARIDVPPSLSFVPMNFETQRLAKVLGTHGLQLDQPCHFSWLGVTQYLTRPAVISTLEQIASNAAKGSTVVFDCLYRPSPLNLPGRWVLNRLSRRYARMGEPWITYLDRAELVIELKAMGYSEVEEISTHEMNERVFKDRRDGLRVRGGRLGGMILARV